MPIQEEIIKYWVLFACGVLATGLTLLWRWGMKKVNVQRKRNDAMEEGIRAILHDRLFQVHRYYMAQGFCTLEEKRNVEYLYKPYHDLGGNGTGETIYEDLMAMPTLKEKG